MDTDKIDKNLHMMILVRVCATFAAAGTALYAAEHHWRWEFWLHLFGHDAIPAWIFWALVALAICPSPSRRCR